MLYKYILIWFIRVYKQNYLYCDHLKMFKLLLYQYTYVAYSQLYI